jgi:hypothetical protein
MQMNFARRNVCRISVPIVQEARNSVNKRGGHNAAGSARKGSYGRERGLVKRDGVG